MPRNESDERSIINKLKLWLLGIIGVVLVAAGIALIALGGQYTSEDFKSHFLTETGIALLPVGLMSLVYEFVLRRAFASEIRELLAEVLSQNFTTQFRPLLAAVVNQEFCEIDNIRKSGLVAVHQKLSIDRVSDLISKARSIRILTTWLHDVISIQDALRLAVENGCDIEILRIKEAAPFVVERAKRLRKPPTYGRDRFLQSTEVLGQLLSTDHAAINGATPAEKLGLWIYDSQPAWLSIQCDDVFFAGFYHYQESPNGVQLEIRGNDTFFAKALDAEFKAIKALSYQMVWNGTTWERKS